jgi:hypothetical protein
MARWILVVVVLLVAGCSAVPSVPTHLQNAKAVIQESGGPFSATYSGSYSLRGCTSPDGDGSFKYFGVGTGSFIRKSTESGSLIGDVHQSCKWSGKTTLTSKFHPQNTITMGLSLNGFQLGTPCAPRFAQKVMFNVLSGTGRFANATGSGTVKFTCSNSNGNGTYSDQWSGTISF